VALTNPGIIFHLPPSIPSILPLAFFSSSTHPLLLLARSAGRCHRVVSLQPFTALCSSLGVLALLRCTTMEAAMAVAWESAPLLMVETRNNL
jgi:hypothetical protein